MKNLLIITQKVDKDDQLLGFFIGWLQEFSERYGMVTVVCLQSGPYSLPSNIHVVSLGKDRGASKLRQLLSFYSAIIGLRRQYDVVFVHMNPIWAVLGAWVWRVLGKRVALWYASKGVSLKLRLAVQWVDVIFTASPESFRVLSPKVTVLGHGIDTNLFQPGNSQRSAGMRLLSVGRIAPVKNYETLIRAAALLRDEGTDFSVTMIGEPALPQDIAYERHLGDMIEELGLVDRFRRVGKVVHRNLVPYYQSHSVFVHLSRTGSLDKAILEAMACGMPVVSCNDSARAFLPPEALFDEGDPRGLVTAIGAVSAEPVSSALRTYVIAHHNVGRLVENISARL